MSSGEARDYDLVVGADGIYYVAQEIILVADWHEQHIANLYRESSMN